MNKILNEKKKRGHDGIGAKVATGTVAFLHAHGRAFTLQLNILQVSDGFNKEKKKNQKASKQSNLPRQPHMSYRIWCTPLASTGGRCDLAPTLHFQPHLPRGHHTLSPSQTHPLPVSQASLVFSSLHPSLCSHCSNRLEFLLFLASPFRTFRAQFIHWLHHQARISSPSFV